jgi:glycosyltransferase involved in cell wall biosynthesis
MRSLSIIVPCYNSQATMEEAVASVYRQHLPVPFEITMVDDGSTDCTYEIMQRLASTHPEIRLVRHQTNLGGGAARNSGVAHSEGELIFCLDADDMLGPDFLLNMVRFWQKKKCDAVGMSTSIKFKRDNINEIAYVSEFEGPGRRVRFESFLEGPNCSLSVVFMMTRSAFRRVGGYPTEHGFDTQGMAFRFLCNGLRAYTCPETTYYHRVGLQQSYYMREQSAGKLNWNWLNVFDEFLYLFRPRVRHELLSAELYSTPEKGMPPNLLDVVVGRADLYVRNYRQLLRMGPRGVARRSGGSSDGFAQYWLGRYHASRGAYGRAISCYKRALEQGFVYRIVFYRMLSATLRLSGLAATTPDALEQLARYCQPYPISRLPARQRMFHLLMQSTVLRQPARIAKAFSDRLRHRQND